MPVWETNWLEIKLANKTNQIKPVIKSICLRKAQISSFLPTHKFIKKDRNFKKFIKMFKYPTCMLKIYLDVIGKVKLFFFTVFYFIINFKI